MLNAQQVLVINFFYGEDYMCSLLFVLMLEEAKVYILMSILTLFRGLVFRRVCVLVIDFGVGKKITK